MESLNNIPGMSGKFQTGQVMMTVGVQNLIAKETIKDFDITKCIRRHVTGDWGDLCEEDKITNNKALIGQGRLFSSYELNGVKIWVITEWDRSVTTILLPDEY